MTKISIRGEVPVFTEIGVYCTCGTGLEATIQNDGENYIATEPCICCLDTARDEGRTEPPEPEEYL